MSISAFSFEGLMIERVIAHKILPKTADKQMTPAKLSNKIIHFKQDAMDTLQLRITEALANKSHGLEMSIRDSDAESFFSLASSILHSDEQTFISVTQRLANKLTFSQFSTNAPGGLLAVISGRVGDDALPFIAAIKAETQNGFRTNETNEQITIEYIAELLLTPSQRFYKIGFLAQVVSSNTGPLVENHRAFLFDHLMSSTESSKAAGYFHSTFLGMSIEKSSKKLTQDFFENTKKFINTALLDDDSKLELHEALRSELRSKKAIISTSDFSKEHLPEDLKDKYLDFMKLKDFPQHSISKDIEYIQAKLKRRNKLVFSSDVWVSVPPDKMKDLVQFEESDDNNFTILKIKGKLKSQE
ncbi:nucleoid-associated protein [Serratia sp. UGAL515B_01]|uniref:nucleoid-associated protein n=1 Tax=Serratia sp. UGAL515B_01 TaxID=2986763 RepID=UPI0029546F2A|nr:nucleoid-associated protein [Serratia sp. UGAL515B_01]WON77816.1 nucleoid-associated protein [Serratia sp. UGAL515B_01]